MRAGTQLWPRVIQLPTTTTYTYNGIGDTSEEKAEAVEAARRNCERHDGAIKQFYLRWHQAVEASNLTYLSKSGKIAPGIEASFTANYGMEYLHVRSSVQVKITVSDPKNPKNLPFTVDIMWLIDTTGSTSSGQNAPITRDQAIANSRQLKEKCPQVAFRFGLASVGDYPIDPFGDPGDKPYDLNSPLSSSFSGWSLTPFSGNDTPEAQLDAALQCLSDNSVGWSGRLKIMVLATDATFHQGGTHTTTGVLVAALKADDFYLKMVGPATIDEYQSPPNWVNLSTAEVVDQIVDQIDELLSAPNQYGITG